MHCKACDVLLTEDETIRKDGPVSYPDLCFVCLPEVGEDNAVVSDEEIVEFQLGETK